MASSARRTVDGDEIDDPCEEVVIVGAPWPSGTAEHDPDAPDLGSPVASRRVIGWHPACGSVLDPLDAEEMTLEPLSVPDTTSDPSWTPRILDRVPEPGEDLTGRWVGLEGAFNFRDLGGYPCEGGRRVVSGVLFRSDALHHLTAADIGAMAALGIRTVIDLRAPDEIERVGVGPIAHAGLGYLNAPVIPALSGEAGGAPPGTDVAERYLWYLDVGRQALVDAIEVIADADRSGVVFHCAAGKDRTGVLAALVLGILGVPGEEIVADYALTNRAMPSILARLSVDPVHAETVSRMDADRRSARPEVMRRFLELVEETYGGPADWALGAGVAPESLSAIRDRLAS